MKPYDAENEGDLLKLETDNWPQRSSDWFMKNQPEAMEGVER